MNLYARLTMLPSDPPRTGRPTKISPDPIIDSVIEFRFETTVPSDAIFGIFFSHIRDKFPVFDRLPTADIPEEIRRIDPNLKYAPHYQAVNGPFRLNLGPNVISISNVEQYAGWEEKFRPFIAEIIAKLKLADIVTKFTRIGIRYIDFFEIDIFNHITLSINYQNEPLKKFQTDSLSPKQTTISVIIDSDIYTTRLNIQNSTHVNINNRSGFGSIIDTDTFYEQTEGFSFEELESFIPKVHENSVNIFFAILRQEFIDSLNPVY